MDCACVWPHGYVPETTCTRQPFLCLLPMSHADKLAQLFHPLQPRAREGGDGVVYRELLPDPLLRGYVCCYWELKTTTALSSPFTYAVVTDSCIDFFFDLQHEDENYIVGFSSSSTSFALEKTFHYAGVRFFPGSFPAVFGIPAAALRNNVHLLRDVIPREHEALRAILTSEKDIDGMKPLFDGYFKSRVFRQSLHTDLRFNQSLAAILQHNGVFSIEKDVATLASPRHLRRLFDFYIGASPKEFHKVIRFQKLIALAGSRQALRNEKIYFDLGYYDQSHFIRDFNALYGTAPSQALP